MAVKKSMSLAEWIESEGTQTVARALKVNESAVRHWRRGWVLPSDETKLKIEKLSNGAVTVKNMIVSHYSPANKKNRWQR